MRNVVVSKTAAAKLDNLLHYLETEWSENVKQRFIATLDTSLKQVSKYPHSFERSQMKPELHRCVVTRQTSIFYTFDEHRIYIVTLFDNRMNSRKLKKQTK